MLWRSCSQKELYVRFASIANYMIAMMRQRA